jgi:hypothetical protein
MRKQILNLKFIYKLSNYKNKFTRFYTILKLINHLINKVEPAIKIQLIETGILSLSPITAHLRNTAKNLNLVNYQFIYIYVIPSFMRFYQARHYTSDISTSTN